MYEYLKSGSANQKKQEARAAARVLRLILYFLASRVHPQQPHPAPVAALPAQRFSPHPSLEIRPRPGRYELILWRCAAGFVPKSAISEISRSGQRKNGRSGGNFLSDKRRAWAILGAIPSGWGQFGAVKKWAVVIGGLRLRRQLNALYAVENVRATLSAPRIERAREK